MIKREVPVALTDKQRGELEEELVTTTVELELLESQARTAASQYRMKAKTVRHRNREIARHLQAGKAPRLMFVTEKLDVEARRVDIFLAQTGEKVDTRDAAPEELNLKIPFLPKDGDFRPGNLVQVADYAAIFRIREIDETHAEIDAVLDPDGDAPQKTTRVELSSLKPAKIGPKDLPAPAAPGDDEDDEEMEDLPAGAEKRQPRAKAAKGGASKGSTKKSGGRGRGMKLVH